MRYLLFRLSVSVSPVSSDLLVKMLAIKTDQFFCQSFLKLNLIQSE